MTVEEKIAVESVFRSQHGRFCGSHTDEMITHGRVGAILWLSNTKEINGLQHLAVEKLLP
jgi:hypothetical protein